MLLNKTKIATNSALVNYITKLRMPRQFYNFTSAEFVAILVLSISIFSLSPLFLNVDKKLRLFAGV